MLLIKMEKNVNCKKLLKKIDVKIVSVFLQFCCKKLSAACFSKWYHCWRKNVVQSVQWLSSYGPFLDACPCSAGKTSCFPHPATVINVIIRFMMYIWALHVLQITITQVLFISLLVTTVLCQKSEFTNKNVLGGACVCPIDKIHQIFYGHQLCKHERMWHIIFYLLP